MLSYFWARSPFLLAPGFRADANLKTFLLPVCVALLWTVAYSRTVWPVLLCGDFQIRPLVASCSTIEGVQRSVGSSDTQLETSELKCAKRETVRWLAIRQAHRQSGYLWTPNEFGGFTDRLCALIKALDPPNLELNLSGTFNWNPINSSPSLADANEILVARIRQKPAFAVVTMCLLVCLCKVCLRCV